MHDENEDVLTSLHVEHPRIGLGDLKTKISQRMDESVVPLSPGLFKAIKRLPKLLHCIHPLALITRWLLHIDFLIRVQLAVKISTVEIE